ncbi:MAG: carbohydrate kinase [Rhodobacteraceae bacterium]|nr:carbohydrate kinase [Paracoccaceae bacterium]
MILVGGENLIDFIQENGGDGYPLYRAIPGGSPYNIAKALSRQGAKTGYLTPISDDTLGALLAEGITDDNLTLLSPRSTLPTSLAVVSLVNGQAAYQFYRHGTAERDLTLASLHAAIPAETTGFNIGSLAITDGTDADAWTEAWIGAHNDGIFTSIDPNIRAPFIKDRDGYLARLTRMLKHADMIKLSDEDIAWITPDQPIEDAAKAMFDQSSAALLVLTLGAEGAIGFTKDGTVRIAPVAVPDLKDTVGAGDTFMGTLLAQVSARGLMTKGALAKAPPNDIRAILETAAKAAAINCGRVGCNPPYLNEL